MSIDSVISHLLGTSSFNDTGVFRRDTCEQILRLRVGEYACHTLQRFYAGYQRVYFCDLDLRTVESVDWVTCPCDYAQAALLGVLVDHVDGHAQVLHHASASLELCRLINSHR